MTFGSKWELTILIIVPFHTKWVHQHMFNELYNPFPYNLYESRKPRTWPEATNSKIRPKEYYRFRIICSPRPPSHQVTRSPYPQTQNPSAPNNNDTTNANVFYISYITLTWVGTSRACQCLSAFVHLSAMCVPVPVPVPVPVRCACAVRLCGAPVRGVCQPARIASPLILILSHLISCF